MGAKIIELRYIRYKLVKNPYCNNCNTNLLRHAYLVSKSGKYRYKYYCINCAIRLHILPLPLDCPYPINLSKILENNTFAKT
ncbi:MAG: hypothetical protein KatS3mg003_1157 [Candidatus Nitrosocaldaceae archaeon]|nr:MAG: hypothetical protein KatS3mg003_0676 [Candidatus Nitrosocaldaceae archaeon]GIU71678.1 MAG: hypothetical protein KatS3mg003_1157 [Candidatus Nitrosocaldaceae archaeon]